MKHNPGRKERRIAERNAGIETSTLTIPGRKGYGSQSKEFYKKVKKRRTRKKAAIAMRKEQRR